MRHVSFDKDNQDLLTIIKNITLTAVIENNEEVT